MTADDAREPISDERLAQIRAMVGRAQVKHDLLDPTDPLDSPCDLDWCHACMVHDLLTEVDRQRAELEQLRAQQRWQVDQAYGAGWYDATYQAIAGRGPDMEGQVAGLRKYHQELEARSNAGAVPQQPEDGDRG